MTAKKLPTAITTDTWYRFRLRMRAAEVSYMIGVWIGENKRWATPRYYRYGDHNDFRQNVWSRLLTYIPKPDAPLLAITTYIWNHCKWMTAAADTTADKAWELTVPLSKSHDMPIDGNAEQQAMIAELGADIRSLLNTVTYREREVIKLRYGIGDGLGYTLDQTARVFRITRERVRQIESKALRKLQDSTRASLLRSHADLDDTTPGT